MFVFGVFFILCGDGEARTLVLMNSVDRLIPFERISRQHVLAVMFSSSKEKL